MIAQFPRRMTNGHVTFGGISDKPSFRGRSELINELSLFSSQTSLAMTDCSSTHGSSTSSSDMNSHHRTVSKIRTIRLLRPHSNGNRGNLTLGHSPFSSFGFSLRGGREFGTGFFISSVVKGSEADLKGLQVGDQIVRVGGSAGSYRVDDAVHKELSQFIINQDRLTLKVRGECGEQ